MDWGIPWKKDSGLLIEDKYFISRSLLNDIIMDAASKLLSFQFPHLHGLKSTLLSQSSFAAILETGDFIAENEHFNSI